MDPTIRTAPVSRPTPPPTPGSAMPFMNTAGTTVAPNAVGATTKSNAPSPALVVQAPKTSPVAVTQVPKADQVVQAPKAPNLSQGINLEEMFKGDVVQPTVQFPSMQTKGPVEPEPTPALIAKELGLDFKEPEPEAVPDDTLFTGVDAVTLNNSLFTEPNTTTPNNVAFNEPVYDSPAEQTDLFGQAKGGMKATKTTWILAGIVGVLAIALVIAIIVINSQ